LPREPVIREWESAFERVRQYDAKIDDGNSLCGTDLRIERLHAFSQGAQGSGSAAGADAYSTCDDTLSGESAVDSCTGSGSAADADCRSGGKSAPRAKTAGA
jgi:hypothetical protein